MSDLRTTLEREMERIPPAPFPMDVVERRGRWRRRRQRIGTTVTALAISGLAVGFIARALPGGEHQPAAPSAGRIVFVSPGGGGDEDRLFSSVPGGGDVVQLTRIHSEYPDWSPDGRTVAFDDGKNLNGSHLAIPNGNVYLVDADGSDLRRVATEAGASSPSWSPDGTRLAVAAERPASSPGISWLDPASGAMTALTTSPFDGYWDAEPDVSPDGSQVAFIRVRELVDRGGERNLAALMIVNADGSGLRRLTPWTTDAGTPAWSPEGARIAFSRSDHFGTHDGPQIEVIGADGSGRTRLTSRAGSAAFWPTWSPDGATIVFTWQRSLGRLTGFGSVPALGGDVVALTMWPRGNQADWGRTP